MAKNGYIVTRSNYTEKVKHKQLPNSDIYERDYMTTTNLGGWDSGSIPYGEGNFKIITKDGDNSQRKHKYGNWLINENCTGETTDEQCEFFTLENLPQTEDVTSETKIVLKENKNSLLDYVYYGNCQELIKSSITNIVEYYPSELYITDKPFEYLTENGTVSYLGGEDMVYIENPFEIDIVTQSHVGEYNPLRYFCDSANLYNIVDESGHTFPVTKWEVTEREGDITCVPEGAWLATIKVEAGDIQLVIKQYYLAKDKFLVTDKSNANLRIRPNNTTIENVFARFDDFDKFLLNRDSKPLYSISIDVPKDTDKGVIIGRKTYTWPTLHDWNLDIESNEFKRYFGGLQEVSEWYDTYRTDNLWRNLTHESIRNMDRTVMYDEAKDEDRSDYLIGKGNLRGLLLAYGRQFDEIKRSIDNIKTTNTVTYNEDNNTPDYFLTDQVNLSGWEVKSVVDTLDKNTSVKDLFSGDDRLYTTTDANLTFLRNLKLNSRGIFMRKGTRQSVEMVLSLFGYKSYDWARKYYEALSNNKKPKTNGKIVDFDKLPSGNTLGQYDYALNEYVVTVQNESTDLVQNDDELPVEEFNSYKKEYDERESTVQGLPVRIMEVEIADVVTGTTGYTGSTVYKYIIPWFDKHEELDGNPYFQMYGGWEHQFKKEVVPNKELYPNVTEIHDTTGFTIFNETKKYLKVVETLEELVNVDQSTIRENDIFYVNDISNIEDYISGSTSNSGYTNYFIIKDVSNAFFCGLSDEYGEGWRNIPKDELSCESGVTDDAYRVIYLENIIEENSGNNPHVGYGKYDNGETYLNYFRQIFKGAIENDLFGDEAYDCGTGELLYTIKNCGFKNISEVVDNVKTWYFTDNLNENNIYQLKANIVEADSIDIEDDNVYEIQNGYEIDDDPSNIVNVGRQAYNNHEVGFTTELSAFNMESQESDSNDEAAANSIINTKKLVLRFSDEYRDNDEFYAYFNKCMLPYIEQVVPSTTIFEVKYGNE